MPFQNWSAFKASFKTYIKNTIGLFTLADNNGFTYFELDYFLERQVDASSIQKKPTLTQIEMLMALSTFMDIHEDNINMQIFSHKFMLFFKTLIEKKYIVLSPLSNLNKKFLTYLKDTIDASAAAAA